MPAVDTLFPTLLGDQWSQLAEPVQRLHGGVASVRARGQADVGGASHFPARCLRRWLGLPSPGPDQALEVTIERRGSRETWTRRFRGRQMRSTLDPSHAAGQLCERLGPVTLRFELVRQGDAIDWLLRGASLFGMPLPRAWLGTVASRSGARDNRYAFDIDSRLPLIGQLVSYRGWLEIVDEH